MPGGGYRAAAALMTVATLGGSVTAFSKLLPMFFKVPGAALASVSAAAFMLLCAAIAVAVAVAFGTVVVCALPFELADCGFTRMSVFVTLIVSAGVFTLVDVYFHLAGLQPAFEEAQQQAAAAGGHYASKAGLHHGWTWVAPLRRQASISAQNFQRATIMEPMPANMQSFATVQSVFLWAQLKGDSLQALLNILGVEVDNHPALSEVIGTMQSRSCPRLSSLRRRLKKPKRWCPGGRSLACVMYIAPSPAGSLMFSLTHRVGRRSSLCCGRICEVTRA